MSLQLKPSSSKLVSAKAQRVVSAPALNLKEKISSVAQKTVAAITATTLVAGSAHAGLTYDELNSLTYLDAKGSGIGNTCPIIKGGSEKPTDIKAGDYNMTFFCMEPTSFTVKEETPGGEEEFTNTKLLTRLTYSLAQMEGKFAVKSDGSGSISESEGLDFSPVTVQLPGGERVAFLFTIKDLQASGNLEKGLVGEFNVPSYRGATFLDPKGRGGATGYDNAVALPGNSDNEEFANEKNFDTAKGTAVFSVAKVDASTGEVAGVFETLQPSDTDGGTKAPKDVKTTGIWYARLI